MDKDAARQKLESDLRFVLAYKEHPITQRILTECQDAQELLLNQVILNPIVSLETFFAHFEAIGHLRGIRSVAQTIAAAEADVKQQLEELN